LSKFPPLFKRLRHFHIFSEPIDPPAKLKARLAPSSKRLFPIDLRG